jgi:hypothetical protein
MLLICPTGEQSGPVPYQHNFAEFFLYEMG